MTLTVYLMVAIAPAEFKCLLFCHSSYLSHCSIDSCVDQVIKALL